jgi:diguanylate cyclase (GGDEF)-like protein
MTQFVPANMQEVLPPWMPWVLKSVQMGLVVVDQDARIAYINDWFLRHAGKEREQCHGQLLTDVFPALRERYYMRALDLALKNGFASLLSNSLHPSPFPLMQSQTGLGATLLLKQSVHVLPMGSADIARAGQRYALIQINDMTQAVNRERLLKAQAAAMHGIARIDALTGIGNRRQFDESLKREFRHAQRAQKPISLVLLDLDHFKLFNDALGHIRGDDALTLAADAVRSVCHRSRDIAARYGGEELVLILPETPLEGACTVAEELLQRIFDLGIAHPQNLPSQRLTASIGVAGLCPSESTLTTSLLELADKALYRAKHTGRNRICAHDGTRVVDHSGPLAV